MTRPNARLSRRTVTVLFCDISGSTALGEQLDAERLRARIERYFAAAREILANHGGTVEKFIGDAVVAVFGIPAVREDDALRAVRAGEELLQAQGALGLQLRIGINTGEVVTSGAGDASFASGDPVNTAARLEQMAKPGTLVMGATTHRLVRDAVEVRDVGPLSLRGKSDPVRALELIRVIRHVDGRSRRMDAPLIGRETELDVLVRELSTTVADRRVRMTTIVGAPGIGKSRLIREFLSRAEGTGAGWLRGRCISYGEGVTFWPMHEIVVAAAGIGELDARDIAIGRLGALADGLEVTDVVQAVAGAIGLSSERVAPDETFWAMRRLLEGLARRQPLAIVVEDIHWAEPTLLDLLEYLVEYGVNAPMVILATARPELLEERVGWAAGRDRMAVLSLNPLASEEEARLLANLPGGPALPTALRSRILDSAEGNPLIVEEQLAMLVDDGVLRLEGDGWRLHATIDDIQIPPSVEALLNARLDRLEPTHRRVAERASVAGRRFSRSALEAMTPNDELEDLASALAVLTRRDFLRPEPDLDPGWYRFRHALIRDAAYASLAKAERVRLHELVGEHLARTSGDRADELSELIAHHMLAAHQSAAELVEDAEAITRLRNLARDWLLRAGHVAYVRADPAAAEKLLSSAISLGDDWARRGEALLALGDSSLDLGHLKEAEKHLAQAIEHSEASGDGRYAARARLSLLHVRHHISSPTWKDEVRQQAPGLLRTLQALGDDYGLARAWRLISLADVDVAGGNAIEKAIEHAELGGDAYELGWCLRDWLVKAAAGEAPTSEVIDRCRSVLDRTDLLRAMRLDITGLIGMLEALAGDEGAAKRHIEYALAGFRELQLPLDFGFEAASAGIAYYVLGEHATAEAVLSEGHRGLVDLEETDLRGYLAAWIARVRLEQGDVGGARVAAEESESTGTADPATRCNLRGVQARLAMLDGDLETGLANAREAVELTASHMVRHVVALRDLAHVLEGSGRPFDAADALRDAIDVANTKGAYALAALANRHLSALQPSPDTQQP